MGHSDHLSGQSLSALVPLQCPSLVSPPSPPFPVVLVTKLSLRSRVQEGSDYTLHPQISLLERTPISALAMVMSIPRLSASSLFPKDTKAPET